MTRINRTPHLLVERGYPHERGDILPLGSAPRLVLGRKDEGWEPDVAFDNAFVSRRQAEIRYEDGRYSILDLGSKHGTAVNGAPLEPFVPVPLERSARIAFAQGLVLLVFAPVRIGETLDLSPLSPPEEGGPEEARLLDPVRQSVRLNDVSYRLSEKEYRFLELLVRKERQFVGREEVVRYVWPERTGPDSADSVSQEEINSLLYRIRKKTDRHLSIESIRGKGYVLQD